MVQLKTVEEYLEKYKTIQKEFPALQEKAMEHFHRLGFPTSKHEEWKYTNINPIASGDFSFAISEIKISKEEILQQFPFVKDAVWLVIENGRWNLNASSLEKVQAGIEIKSLRESKNNPVVQKHFNLYADVQADAFAALNTAFSNDGLFIHIHPDIVVSQPVFIIHVSSSAGQATVSHHRLLVVAEKNSSVKISTLFVSQNESAETFANVINEIVADTNAVVELDLLQNENKKSFQICGTHVYQSAGSQFNINTIALGNRILKNKLHIKLDGSNAENHMHGLYLADENQLTDNHTAVYHTKPHCNSNQLYKGIIGGKAHGVFNGKIFVEKDAQKTNAYQSNKNILLSNDAVINAKPQLEIFADDVKCSHGATTGQMDEDAVFYLRSRGIGEENAKALLNVAFANDILNNISIDSFRDYVSSLVESKLKEAVK
jgi:Fe-S cluster assembly protein SufD